jgi:type IV pilus biogenesis protein CpaD/CtpE
MKQELLCFREQKERERLQKLEQERERKQKEEEERRKKEEMKRKKAEQERIEKDKAEKAAKIKVNKVSIFCCLLLQTEACSVSWPQNNIPFINHSLFFNLGCSTGCKRLVGS